MTKTDLFVNRVMSFFDPVMTLIMNGLPLSIYIIGAILMHDASLFDKLFIFENMIVFSTYAIQIIQIIPCLLGFSDKYSKIIKIIQL